MTSVVSRPTLSRQHVLFLLLTSERCSVISSVLVRCITLSTPSVQAMEHDSLLPPCSAEDGLLAIIIVVTRPLFQILFSHQHISFSRQESYQDLDDLDLQDDTR
ncbi:hypothetical protein GEMRC1_005051 [Eukaryota sp. GEM-RC1]